MTNDAVAVLLAEYSAIGTEKRMQQWTLRLLHAFHLVGVAALLWALSATGPALEVVGADGEGSSVIALLAASVVLTAVLSLLMTAAMFQVHVLSRKLAAIEERINSELSSTVLAWEHHDVPAIYYTGMGNQNFVYRADRVVFPLTLILQLAGSVVVVRQFQLSYGLGFGLAFALVVALLLGSASLAGFRLLRFLRATRTLDDLRN